MEGLNEFHDDQVISYKEFLKIVKAKDKAGAFSLAPGLRFHAETQTSTPSRFAVPVKSESTRCSLDTGSSNIVFCNELAQVVPSW